ncbi:MAG: hypothetical protein A4E71_01238 [Smithella sp. PtaU1.Bin162]|nr:MAG: hypothetical protein A4E71_01238 [Smithella sp. PtaU1.Bin162]
MEEKLKAKPLSDREYAECFNVFKGISTEWTAIQDWLRDTFLPSVPLKNSAAVLSVGSGTGDFDLALMKLLREKIPRIDYTALDPNKEHNRIFRNRYNNEGKCLNSLKIIAQAFGLEKIRGKFDIVHLTHCLYYIPDRRAALSHAWELLAQDGAILIFHQTALGINEIQKAFMKRVKGSEKEIFSTYDIIHLLNDMKIPYKHDILISDLDVTDCVEGNIKGRQLLSFLLEANCDEIDDDLKKEIITFIKDTCRQIDGRYFLFHPGGIFWICKSSCAGK